ncbi:hypothetical protein E4T56_gene3145 [Termitomyces sp. T112]|nr:hypothetical protein E4T56_gene3145 [Termitomyces sp. T112]
MIFKCSTTTTGRLMPPPNEPNDATSQDANPRSFLVTLFARAIGSLGFGLSILAIGLRWFVPLATPVTPGVEDKPKKRVHNRSRRRLVLAVSTRLIVQQTTPSITVIRQNTSSNSYCDKHVYFADTQDSQGISTSTADPLMIHDSSVQQFTAEENSPSSTPIPLNTPLTISIPVKRDDESAVESDFSSRRSSLSFHLPKRILPFGKKSRQHFDSFTTATQSSSIHDEGKYNTLSDPKDDISSRRPPPLESTNLISASSDPVQPSVVSYLSLKAHRRRTSAPTARMRTQPYDAPYFASPPTSASLDLRKSPPMLQEASIDSTMQHSSEDSRGRSLQSPRQSLTKPRSANRKATSYILRREGNRAMNRRKKPIIPSKGSVTDSNIAGACPPRRSVLGEAYEAPSVGCSAINVEHVTGALEEIDEEVDELTQTLDEVTSGPTLKMLHRTRI